MSTRKIQSVLYVDDDPASCEVVQATLSLTAGLDVYTACSGEHAIDLAYELRPDLILIDVMTPELDRPSTLGLMREHALLADIPVIFLVAKALPRQTAHYLQLGAIGVIGKPIDSLKLGEELFAIWEAVEAARGLEATLAEQAPAQDQGGSLTDSFLQRAKNDVIRLRAIIERARHENLSILEEAERIAHSIHGAGAMFGFPEVSAAGGAIEKLVGSIMLSTASRGSTYDPWVLQQLLDFTDRLAQDVDNGGQTALRSVGMFHGLGGVR